MTFEGAAKGRSHFSKGVEREMMGKSLLGLNLLAFLAIAGSSAVIAEAALAQLPSETGGVGAATYEDGEEISHPSATTLADWVAQIEATLVQITGIRLASTATGLQVILETRGGALMAPTTTVSGNALIIEIANAVLPEQLQEFEPAEGIALVQATALPGDRVQIAITGTDAPPTAAVSLAETGLTLRITPGVAQIGEADDAIQIVVTGDQNDYVVPTATTATRTDTPLDEIPQSIQVIPQAVLEDQQVIRLNDALRNASGVVSNSNDQRGQRFIIRGFSSSSILRDGFRLTNGSNGNAGFQELANVERVEVLKGPAAILAGALEPGGAINLVTEQPLSEPFYELSFRVGNRELLEPSIDISGPLTDDGRLLYRLNALYRNEDYHRDFDVPVERVFIAPVISWAISDRSDLTLELEYSSEDRPADFGGLPAIGDRVAAVPFDRITGEPGDNASNESLRVGYQFEHRLSDSWQIRNRFRYVSFDNNFVSNTTAQVNENTGDLFRVWIQNAQPADSYELQTNVVGEFATGSIEHTLLVGIDLYRRDADTFRRIDPTPQPLFNIFNPVYGLTSRPDSFNDPAPQTVETQTNNLGIYIQDQITLLDNLFLLAGLRYDTVTETSENFDLGTRDSQSSEAFTPRIGIVYQPIEPLSLYTSYSTSFAPNSGTDRSGDLLAPERGQQFEVGARAELLGGRLSANLALFHLTKQNVATADPNSPPGQFFSVATGEQRSQGVELDVIGEILPGWNIVANYAYTDADITQDNEGLAGNRIFGVPEHNVNLWTIYEIQQGDLAGLGFGIGVNYVSDRFGDNANSYLLEEYFLTNAAISYQRDNWRAALNIRNLFDVNYIDSSEGTRFIENRPGEGFTIIGSFSVEF
ncbi:MAG: TonB-dependent receptor [Cyanobacteria bacterium J06642_9]